MLLVKNGKSDCCIITEEGNEAALFAATELQGYVLKATGAELPINPIIRTKSAFYVGGACFADGEAQAILNRYAKLSDGFVLQIKEEEAVLAANSGRGVIFGVYRFLERFLNVRFFNIDCEAVPRCDKIELTPALFQEEPAFIMRSYLTGKLCWREGEEFRRYYLKMKQCNEHTSLNEAKYGGACSMYGREGAHNMSRYVPFERYGKTHPEFYEITDSPFTGEYGYCTIDLQNGITEDGKVDEGMDVSVFKVVLAEMKKDILANPDKLFFQFEQEDGEICKQYQEGTPQAKILEKYGRSGILMRFCNALAVELQKWANEELGGREIMLETFGYSYCADAPVKFENGKCVPIDETVVAVDNLVIRLAQDANYAWNHFDEHNTTFVKRMNAWRVVCKKFMFWSYDMDDSTHLWYFPSLHAIKKNVTDIKDYGATYLMYEASEGSPDHWQADMRGYIYANLMWNPYQSAQALYEEYMQNYYGVAAEGVKKIVAILENYSMRLREIYADYNVGCFGNYKHKDLVSEKLLDRLLRVYEATEASVATEATEREVLLSRLYKVKATLLHMKAHKVNHEMFDCIARAGITRFSGQADIHKNLGQTLYNADLREEQKKMEHIPEEIRQRVLALDAYSIADTVDLDKT